MSPFDFIGRFEGCHAIRNGLVWPYVCPAGYWTQGWGRLVSKDAAAQTKETVDGWFRLDLMKFEDYAFDLSPVLVNESEGRQTAITSFVYNLGPGAYKSSTLRRRVNEKKWEEAAQQIVRWNKGGGRVLPGLVLRRAAEAVLLRS